LAADKVDATMNIDSAAMWSPTAAAKYMDTREAWWQKWPNSKRDHETVCISCHSALPYALARPSLRKELKEDGPSPTEQFLLAGVTKRVSLWNEVEPFYSDDKQGAPKSAEARGTESVLNALILASDDARRGHLSDVTSTALDNLWALQLKNGEKAGAWTWLNFHLAPWETVEGQYYGAAMAALAVGTAPDRYASSPAIQENLSLLKNYLQRNFAQQPLLNQVAALWASSKLPGLVSAEQRSGLIDAIFLKQQKDGGWSLTNLGDFKRKDNSELSKASDGYATGLIVLALENAGVTQNSEYLGKGVAWLQHNQNKAEGFWPASSLNKERDPASERGRFMSDAATAFSVLALEEAH
jgi:squalene-hopene/tetraprenyl-beta-curcumene cyclase